MLKNRIERLEAQFTQRRPPVDIVAILNEGRQRSALGLPRPPAELAEPVDEATKAGRAIAAARRRVGILPAVR